MKSSWLIVVLVLGGGSGCHLDPSAKDRCNSRSDCVAGLECIEGQCRLRVDAGRDAQPSDSGRDAEPQDNGGDAEPIDNDAEPSDAGGDAEPNDNGGDAEPTDADAGGDAGGDAEPQDNGGDAEPIENDAEPNDNGGDAEPSDNGGDAEPSDNGSDAGSSDAAPADGAFDLPCGTITRVSAAPNGTDGNGRVEYHAAPSADGRYVAFASAATNLIPSDLNNAFDVFVRDVALGTTERVSVSSAGVEGNADSGYTVATQRTELEISDDGRYVLFRSSASTLVAAPTLGFDHYYVRDRQLGTTERVDVSTAGDTATSYSGYQRLSASGRRVFFGSDATNLSANDTNTLFDIFVRDLDLGTTELVSIDVNGMQFPRDVGIIDASPDGNFVLLVVNEELPNGDYNPYFYLRDLIGGITTALPYTAMNRVGNRERPYYSFATSEALYINDRDQVPADMNQTGSVYIYNTTSQMMSVIDYDSTGQTLQFRHADQATASRDFSLIAFETVAQLDPNDANTNADIYVRDRTNGMLQVVSVGLNGFPAGIANLPRFSADGRFISFWSAATNLVPNDGPTLDIYTARYCR